ncbi:MAG: Uncharacterised protein [Porticoccaceae bacterium UBA1117]|nr:MAG: Uncharacterised protein [Porticoccaceae bacterium UBA1117]
MHRCRWLRRSAPWRPPIAAVPRSRSNVTHKGRKPPPTARLRCSTGCSGSLFGRKCLKMDDFSLKSTLSAPVPPSAPAPAPKSGRLVSAGDRPGPLGGPAAAIVAHQAAEGIARLRLEPGCGLGSAPPNGHGDHRRWRRWSAPRSPPIAAAPRGRP